MKRIKLGATGEFPRGRLNPSDEGELRMAIAHSVRDKLVRIEFGKPVAWLALPPKEAAELGALLLSHARALGWKEEG